MPNQTTKTATLRIKDGCKVSVKESGAGSYTDLGEVDGDVKLAVTWTEFIRQTGNAGIKDPIIRSMMIDGSFTLADLDPSGIPRISNGVITSVTTTASPTTTLTNQTIAANWTAGTPIHLNVIDSSTSVSYKCTALTLTSVTASSSGALSAVGGVGQTADYALVTDTNSPSGYSIIFFTTGPGSLATSESVVVDFDSATPIASTMLYGGTTSLQLQEYALKFTHVDSASATDFEVILPVVYSKSGWFTMDFGGQGSDGVDTIPVQFRANIDPTGTDGRQLFSYFTAA